MPMTGRAFDPVQLIWAALSFPPISLLIAILIAGGIVLVASRAASAGRQPNSVRDRYAPEHRALGAVAVGVIVLFIAEFVLRGYVFTAQGLVHWWRFAVPLACAIVGLCIVLGIIVTRGTTSPDEPVMTATRRDWTSFSSRTMLVGVAAAALALVATTVAAGLASSANGQGQHVWLAIPVPNEAAIDPIRLPFYGWTYGVPVLICLAALVIVFWAALDRNSARPFMRAETVTAERAARRGTARDATRIVTATMLLTVAGAWRLIASAGSVSSLTITGQNGDAPYDAAWRYAELAIAAGWFAPILEVIAFVLLLLAAASGLRPARNHREPTRETKVPVSSESAR